MNPTLNQADVELLKGIFATRDDLGAMEKRQDEKYATKEDLKQFATKEDLKQFATKVDINKRFDELEATLAETFQGVEERLQVLESTVGISKSN